MDPKCLTVMVFMKFFEKIEFEKYQHTIKKHMQRINFCFAGKPMPSETLGQCVMCEFVIKEVVKYLKKNSSEVRNY